MLYFKENMNKSKLYGALILSAFCAQSSFADIVNTESGVLTAKQAEAQKLSNYDGVTGTAPAGKTISAVGLAMEQWPNATQMYAFFTQNLANDVYYEVRLYGRYNYKSMNPLFPSVPASNINNPPGYGYTGILGYNFHPTELIDITPFIRLNYMDNMNVVYEDTNGDFIHSLAWSAMIGSKFAFKVSKGFTPFFNYYVGYQSVNLNGNFTEGSTPNTNVSGTVEQLLSLYEIGVAFKASQSISIIPYYDYVTVGNNPDNTAAAAYSKGGFNISSLTSTMQLVGVKLSYAW